MDAWILLIGGILLFFLLAALICALVCFMRVFYSPRRRELREDEHEIPDGEEYLAHREQIIE